MCLNQTDVFAHYIKLTFLSVVLGIMLGQLEINTSLATGFIDGEYTLVIKFATSQKIISIDFEYKSSGLTGGTESNKFLFDASSGHLGKRLKMKAKVTGKVFRISFYQEIFFKDPKTISVIIIRADHQDGVSDTPSPTYVIFKSSDALTLLGSVRLDKCPSGICLDVFTKWRRAYKQLVLNGRADCATDSRIYYSYLSFCNDITAGIFVLFTRIVYRFKDIYQRNLSKTFFLY